MHKEQFLISAINDNNLHGKQEMADQNIAGYYTKSYRHNLQDYISQLSCRF